MKYLASKMLLVNTLISLLMVLWSLLTGELFVAFVILLLWGMTWIIYMEWKNSF